MSATIPLTTFARNPRKALRRLPADGLVLTRPGESPLRITVEVAHAGESANEAGGSALIPAHDARAAVEAEGTRAEQESGPAEIPSEPDEPVDDAPLAALDDLARAALLRVSPPQLVQIVCEANSWIEALPPAARRMAFEQIESARAASGDAENLARNLATVLDAWHIRALPFAD